MGKIEGVSRGISKYIGNKLNKNEEEIAVLNYGLFILIHTSLAIILTFIMGLITNTVIEIMIISITAALLKRYSGGSHSTSPERCIVTGLVCTLTLSIVCKYIVKNYNNYTICFGVIISLLVSIYILYRKCPVPSKNKPLTKENTRKKLRHRAFILFSIYVLIILLLCILNTYAQSQIYIVIITAVVLGVLLQVIALTKVFNYTLNILEFIYDLLRIN